MYAYEDEIMVKKPTITKSELRQKITKLETKVYGHPCSKNTVTLSNKRKPFSIKGTSK